MKKNKFSFYNFRINNYIDHNIHKYYDRFLSYIYNNNKDNFIHKNKIIKNLNIENNKSSFICGTSKLNFDNVFININKEIMTTSINDNNLSKDIITTNINDNNINKKNKFNSFVNNNNNNINSNLITSSSINDIIEIKGKRIKKKDNNDNFPQDNVFDVLGDNLENIRNLNILCSFSSNFSGKKTRIIASQFCALNKDLKLEDVIILLSNIDTIKRLRLP